METTGVPIRYTACGGVVTDQSGERVLLLIRPSRDEVRLPKGHLEPTEAIVDAALREVQEETGLCDIEVIADLGTQAVAFPLGKHVINRIERYFLMRARSLARGAQPEADAQEFFPIWVTWQEALEHLTFEAERIWVGRARQAMGRLA